MNWLSTLHFHQFDGKRSVHQSDTDQNLITAKRLIKDADKQKEESNSEEKVSVEKEEDANLTENSDMLSTGQDKKQLGKEGEMDPVQVGDKEGPLEGATEKGENGTVMYCQHNSFFTGGPSAGC